ncbi:hypothetical protein Ddc_10598 [Ditylenchus destructor]|nr:hypothetical protein Ddc_10598 [Ditylenchus destructor]
MIIRRSRGLSPLCRSECNQKETRDKVLSNTPEQPHFVAHSQKLCSKHTGVGRSTPHGGGVPLLGVFVEKSALSTLFPLGFARPSALHHIAYDGKHRPHRR